MSMRLKLMVTIALTAAVALLVAGVGTVLLSRTQERQRTEDELLQQAEGLVEAVALVPSERQISRERLTRIQEALQVRGVGLVVLSGTDNVLSVDLPGQLELDDLDLSELRAGRPDTGTKGEEVFVATVRSITDSAQIVIVLTRVPESTARPLIGWFMVAAAAALLLAFFASVWLSRALAAPLVEASDVTRRVADGDLGARMAPPRSGATDEAAELARSVNEMGAALERARGLERQFLLSVSHDLRTPMTSIQGYAEALTDGAIADPQQAGRVILSESRRLDRLVRDLLELARLDSRQFSLDRRRADLRELVDDVVRGQAPSARSEGIELVSLVPDDECWARVDIDRLAQALANLIENALRYARSVVRVGLEQQSGEWMLAVADDGPGIPDEDLPHVFERLYRAHRDPRDRESGSGLGLAIVRELVRAMDGSVAAARSELGGAELVIRLPVDG
ncbi:MAG: HAMP domain-containing histidine kinase [Acidimicrobiia bacterium]|nr:HAMP domain-containing histidine kinase [Acidimicrobiia bacterium]